MSLKGGIMEKLTTKQEMVLKELKKFMAQKGYPPTVRELCECTNLNSTATVQVHLDNLQEKGYIKKDPEKNRTIELLVPNEFKNYKEHTTTIPLLGKVTAGNPIEAIEMPDEFFEVPESLVSRKKTTFALRVSGNSMIKAGIFDQDIIVVERAQEARNGQIVVAMTNENEVTVKRFYKEKNHIRLQPENDLYEPILLEEVSILGKVIGLYRKF